MEEMLLKVIREIESATGKKPRRIEMDGGEYMIKYSGVEVLVTVSQFGKLIADNKFIVTEANNAP